MSIQEPILFRWSRHNHIGIQRVEVQSESEYQSDSELEHWIGFGRQ